MKILSHVIPSETCRRRVQSRDRRYIPLVFLTIASLATIAAGILPGTSIAAARHVTPTPSPSPTPIPPEDPAVTKIAQQQFISWQAGTLNRKSYTDAMNALITQQQIDDTSNALGQLGAFLTSEYFGPQDIVVGIPAGSKTYLYRMHCTNSSVYMQFSLTPQGKIAALIFRNSLYDINPTPSPSPTDAPTEPPY